MWAGAMCNLGPGLPATGAACILGPGPAGSGAACTGSRIPRGRVVHGPDPAPHYSSSLWTGPQNSSGSEGQVILTPLI